MNTKEKNHSFPTVLAKVVSYVFHPLFIPCYFFLWIYYRFPSEFAAASINNIRLKFLAIFITTVFFPAFTVFLLWKLKFISNIYLKNKKERIVPYLAAMIFYWWMWYLSRNFNDQALALKYFFFGIFLATVPALILNTYIKVSMHAMGITGLATAMIIACFMYEKYYGLDLVIIILLTGIICTARLFLKQHSSIEIYTGVFIGIISQIISYFIMI